MQNPGTLLPRVSGAPVPASASSPAPASTVLIVEDDAGVAFLQQRQLERAGYRVETVSTLAAANGREAVRLFEQHRDSVALALLDVIMPDLGGHDVCHHIRQLAPEVPVIFCTGYDPASSPLTEDRCRLLEKPFTPRSLLEAVREILDQSPVHA